MEINSIMINLNKSYCKWEYEKELIDIDCTKTLLEIVYRLSVNKIKLSAHQIEGLLEDINILKSLDLWDYDREAKLINEIHKKHEFMDQLKKLPEADIKRYFRDLEKEGIFEL